MKKALYLLMVIFSFSCNNKKESTTTLNSNEKIEDKTIVNDKVENIQDSSSIANVALNFINGYTDNCNKMKKRIGIIEWVSSNQYTSDKFKTQLKNIIKEADKKDPDYGLGFDPIFNAQDFPDEGFKLVNFDTISGFVNVKDKILDGFEMKIKLVKEKDKWLVDGCGIINMSNE